MCSDLLKYINSKTGCSWEIISQSPPTSTVDYASLDAGAENGFRTDKNMRGEVWEGGPQEYIDNQKWVFIDKRLVKVKRT